MRMKEIKEAFDILSDDKKRRKYNKNGEDCEKEDNINDDPNDKRSLYEILQSTMDDSKKRSKVKLLQLPWELTLEEIYEGAYKEVKLNRIRVCGECKG